MMEATQVEIFDLIQARKKLALLNKPVILTNAAGTIRTIGAIALDKIFKTLAKEFLVTKVIFNVEDDLAGLFCAIELGYQNISYKGKSVQASKILQQLKSTERYLKFINIVSVT